jgi:23S rRNA pseudouridine1911/1915/1917 synthase
MEDNTRRFVVAQDEAGMRLDLFCAAHLPEYSRNQIQKLNSTGSITVNAERRAHHFALRAADSVEVTIIPAETESVLPVAQKIPITLLYEDDDLVVVNKAAGMVVHPAQGNRKDTLVNALLGRGMRLASLGGPERPGIVHRLDKDTSGVLVIAKSDAAHAGLARQMRERSVERMYHAITWGTLGIDALIIDKPIGRHPVHRKKMAVLEGGGREAVSQIFVMDSFNHFEYIRVVLKTGRTHQIRVHLSHMSHPVLGDPVYGGRRKKGTIKSALVKATFEKLLKIMPRQALHASSLAFSHPVTGQRLLFRTALPADMRSALEVLFIEDLVQGG